MLLPFACLAAWAGNGEDEETVAARALLERLKAVIAEADRDAAESLLDDEVFEAPARLQTGFLRYLDGEWDRRKREYLQRHQLKTASLHGSTITVENTRAIKKHRETLARIRALTDDGEMKKAIEAEGRSALASLEKLYQPETRDPVEEIPDLRRLRDSLLVVGHCRVQLREEMLEAVPADPAEELKALLPESGSLQIPLPGNARAVLRRNAALAEEIEPAEAKGIAQLNHWRILLGLDPLIIDPKLCEAARDHSKDMAEQGFFSHTNPDPEKSTPSARARRFGTSASGENIAIAAGAEAANRSWFGSPGHHRNMFGNYSVVGLGGQGRHWTQNFR